MPNTIAAPANAPALPGEWARGELPQLTEEKTIAAYLVRERQALIDRWTPEQGGRTWMRAYSDLLDAVVRRLLALSAQRTLAANNDSAGSPTGPMANSTANPTAGIAILAVGGYGQRLCAPHSDLDLTFLSQWDDDPAILHQMFPLVMDVLLSGAKIRVGYAYRTLSELRGDTLDHQTQTALLDARLVAGDRGLFQHFQSAYGGNLPIADFLFRKEAERRKIRERWGNSPYIVEPNVKEGVGGLRDLQTAAWMARIRFGKNGEALWRDLLRRRVITRNDLHALGEKREMLLSVRVALHLLSGERRDVLTARRQEEVAARLRFADGSEGLPAVEQFMERYYAAAGAIVRIADKVMARCLDAPLPLGTATGLSSVRRAVAITDPARAEMDPLWPMAALAFCQEHRLELALPTEEAIENYVAAGNADVLPALGTGLIDLLAQSGDSAATLRRMQRTTLLGAILPELDRCMGLIPYDSSHAHTVGEHSLRVLGHLLRLRDEVADGDPHLGGYRAILQSLISPLPLFLAALLHDVGKQWPHLPKGERAGHEITGAERVPEICQRLGCSESVTTQVQFLVRHHLLLSHISRLRDLTLSATLREVIHAVAGDRERLRMLYLLTWADTVAVGPGVWTDMSARLLDELFSRTEAAIDRAEYATDNTNSANYADSGESAPDAAMSRADASVNKTRLDSVRQRLQRRLTREPARFSSVSPFGPVAESDDAVREHIHRMPAAYLLNTPPETIALHVALVERLRQQGGVLVDLRVIAPGAAQTEMTVVTRDAPGLFARLTGVLFASDVRLHRAQAFTRPLGDENSLIAIDTLIVDYRDRPLGPERRRMVEQALNAVLSGTQTIAELIAQRRRGVAARDADVAIRTLLIDDRTSPDYTLIDIETLDDTGVTYRLSDTFAHFGWDIHSARISTWGGHARCAFYITDATGSKIEADTVRERLQPLITGDGAR